VIFADKLTCFAHIDRNLDVDKCVEFSESLTPKVYFHKRLKEVASVNSIDEVEKLLQEVEVTRLCIGYTDKDNRTEQRSTNCTGHIPFGAAITKIRCIFCDHKQRSEQRRKKRIDRAKAKEEKARRNKEKSQKIRRMKNKKVKIRRNK